MRLWWLLFAMACTRAEAVEETRREVPKRVVDAKPRHVAMAEQVVAAIVAQDPAKLPPMSKLGKEHMGEDSVRDGFGELLEKLEEAKVDVAKLTFVKAEPSGSEMIQTVDVTLAHEGRQLTFHFNAMPRDGYAFMGISTWFKWVP